MTILEFIPKKQKEIVEIEESETISITDFIKILQETEKYLDQHRDEVEKVILRVNIELY
jgi:hypothetical protein